MAETSIYGLSVPKNENSFKGTTIQRYCSD
jgi:hypothetical protein